MHIKRVVIAVAVVVALSPACTCGAPPAGEGEGEGHAGEGEGEGHVGEGEGEGHVGEGEGEGHVGEGEGEGVSGEGEGVSGEGEGEGEGIEGVLSSSPGCTDGWCWENPRPVGGPLRAVWAVAPNDVWMATQRHFLHFDGTGWSQAPMLTVNGAPVQVNAFWGAASNDVWAAANGLMHWDGVAWTASLLDVTAATSVSGVAANDAWAAGFLGVAHYDGQVFTRVTMPQGFFASDVWAFAPGRAVVGGNAGAVVVVDASDQSVTDLAPPASAAQTVAVFASAADDVWAATTSLEHLSGGSWQTVTLPAGNGSIVDIWGDGASDVFFLRSGGQVLHFDGNALTVASATSSLAARISGTAHDDVWVATFLGQALHGGDTAAFTDALAPVAPSTEGPSSIAVLPGGEGFATTQNDGQGVFLHRASDGTWSSDTLPVAPTVSVFGVAATAAHVFLLTNNGSFARAAGDASFTAIPNTSVAVHDVCATDDGLEHGAGRGTSLFLDGDWLADTHTTNTFFNRAFCVGNDWWAVSAAGGWAHTTPLGNAVSIFGLSAFGSQPLTGYAASPTDARVLLSGGVVMRWNGARWAEEITDPDLRAIAGRAQNDVWIVGDHGTALHDDGTGYSTIAVPADEALIAVSQAGSQPLTVAKNGDVWRFPGNTWTVVGSGFDASATSTSIAEAAFVGDEAFAIGNAHEALKLVNGTWTPLPQPETEMDHVSASDAAGAFFIGGAVFQWDDTAQQFNAFGGIGGSTPSVLFFPGDGSDVFGVDNFFGCLLHFANGRFNIVGDLNDKVFTAFGSSSTDLWVLGEDTSFFGGRANFRFDGNTLVPFVDAGPNLAVGTASNGDVVGVDTEGNLWTAAGDFFVQSGPTQSEALTEAVVVNEHDVWALDQGGVVHFDGAAWSAPDTLGGTSSVSALNLSSGRLYAGVGQGGVLARDQL